MKVVSAEQEAGGSAAATAAASIYSCGGNTVPLSANIPALCGKQRCDPDHWIFFHKHPQSSRRWSLPPQPSPRMDADYGREKRGKRQRDGEREAPSEEKELMLMWKCNETDEGEMEGNKGGQETRGAEAPGVFSPPPPSFSLCLRGCDATFRQPVF